MIPEVRRIIAVVTVPLWIVALVVGLVQPDWWLVVAGAAGLCAAGLNFRNR